MFQWAVAGGGTRWGAGQLFEARLEEKQHHLSWSQNDLADDIQISPVGLETLGLPRSMPSTLAIEESEHGTSGQPRPARLRFLGDSCASCCPDLGRIKV